MDRVAPRLSITAQEPERIPALDGLRGIAILLVLIAHVRLGSPPGLLGSWYETIVLLGFSGVDLFFVLSGFLITGILVDSRDAPRFFRNFYMRRVLRIFPLYYGVVFLLVVVFPLWRQPPTPPLQTLLDNQWWYWLHATNVLWALGGNDSTPYHTGHFWSLAVEEQFYLVWPLVVYICSPRILFRVCLGCIAGAFLLRLALSGVEPAALAYALMPARVDALAVGGALALLARRPGGLEQMVSRARRAAIALGCLFVMLFIPYQRIDHPAARVIFTTIGYTVVALFYGALLVLVSQGRSRAVASHPVLRFFGKYSYGMYVFHWPLLLILAPLATLAHRLPLVFGWAALGELTYFVIGTSLVVLISVLSWHLYEKHFLALRRHFVHHSSQRRHATADQSVVSGSGGAVSVAGDTRS